MNNIFRLVLSRATGQWVPVSEETRGAAKGRRQLLSPATRSRMAVLTLLSASLDYSGLTQAAPTGAQVTAGSGTVTQTGNNTAIVQTSANLFLNWQSFNVSANEVVNFIQPSASSIAVNRILGNSGSQIFGHLDANGQVWLINPNGILFGLGAQVNVGGLTASTLDVSDASFRSDLRSLSGSGDGTVVNRGTIQAANGGYVALLGNQVSNEGVIRAQLGTVALGAGSAETLTFNGRQLIHLRVDQSTLNDLAANAQLIQADGGRVIMAAGAQNTLLASVVNNTGIVRAQSVENHNGTITLLAGMAAGQVNVGGTLDATGHAGETGGSIETSGAAVSVASSAKIVAGPGGSWRIDPTDLTIDVAAATAIDNSLNNGTSVIEATTATTASGSGNQSTGLGDINVDAPIAWTNPAAVLTLTAYNAINVNASVTGSGAVMMQAGTGNLTIASGASIEGDAGVVLATGANFVNLAGPNALSAGLTGAWQVYSTNPTLDTPGGLTPAFIQYAAASQTGPAQAGNGLLYSVAPSVTVTALAGTATKTYDGGTNASLTAANSNYTVSGTMNGDTVTSMNATYQTADAGSNIPVTSANSAAGLTITNANGVPVYGYGLAGAPVTASIGTIAAAQLSAAIVGDAANPSLSKVYDGTTTTTFDSGNYQLTGFVAGQSASVNQPTSVGYVSATAGTETVNATFSPTNFAPGSGTKLSNYILPTTASGSGTVLQAPLVITGVLATDKVYDATTTDALDTTHAGVYGVIGNDAVSLSTSGANGSFVSPNVGNNMSVGTSGFSLTGAQQNDYQLIAPASLTASITPALLSITGVSAANKVYDGNTAAALIYNNPQLSGLVGVDVATVVLSHSGATATFSSKNAGAGLPVSTIGFSIAGTNASNYDLTQASGFTADITAAPLTVTLIGNPSKPYNGTTTAALSSANFTVTGFVAGEGATIPQTALSEYASPNAGAQSVTATLAGPDFATSGGALLSNYSVPTTVSGAGTITPAPLTGTIVGNPSKVFDGTTSATLTGSNYALTGFLTGQGATVNQPNGLYGSANAGLQQVTATLTTGNYTGTSGTLLSNYSLPTSVTGAGTITQAALAGHIYAGITGNPTKPYDGTTAATLTPGDFALTGFVGSDGATVTQTVGQYASANAGVEPINAALTNPNFTATGSTILANYTLPTSAYGSGTITPVALSVTVINDPTRVYNGSTSMVLTSSNYSIAGFVSGESAQINPSALINYGSANVGTQSISAALTPSAYTVHAGTLLSNYVLASSATGTGQITPASLYVTGLYATNKVYDTTSVDPLNAGSQALSGVVSSDAASVSLTGVAAGAFASTQVGAGLPVSVSGLSIVGSAASNYTLQPVTGLAASITPAPLTITGVSANSKPYDGINLATLNTTNEALSGLYTGDAVTVSAASAASAFASVNVGSNLKVNANGFVIGGAQASDYALHQPTGMTANITQAPITALIIGNPTKVYDGSASTTLTSTNYSLLGFATVGGVTQGASVPQSATASYTSPDAGVGVAIGSTLVLSDFVANAGTNLSNYALPTTGAGTGTITQAPLTAALIGNPTKTYDDTATAALTAGNYALSGFVGGQSAAVNQTSGDYASANAGSHSVTAGLTAANYSPATNTNLSNYALPVSATGMGTIARAPLTVVGVATTPQVYNGTTSDALTGGTLTGTTYAGDSPVLTNVAAGTLGSSGNAGTDAVTTSMGLSGAGSGNYSISQPTGLMAVISPAPLSASSSVAKTYDGTTSANLSGSNTTFVGFVGSDGAIVNAGVTGTFATPNAGTGIAVTGGALIAGDLTATGSTLLSNYTLPSSDSGSGSIAAAALTYTATPSSQQYGLTPAGLVGSITGFVDNETLATVTTGTAVFSTPATGASNVGHYLIAGAGLAANNGNYVFLQAGSNATALTITQAPLTVSGVQTTSRAYNGTTLDAISGATISGVTYNSDALTLTGSASGTLGSSGNVGTDAVTTNMALGGTARGNYSLTQETGLTANISSLALSATSSVTRSYNGTVVASLSGANTILSGFVTGQGATVNTGVTGIFANANVAGGISIVGGGLSAGDMTATGGTVLANYTLPTTDNGSGSITPATISLSGSRAYDGLLDANANIFGTAGTVNGVAGENLILSGSGTLSTKNVITNGAMASSSGLTLGNGTGLASNYKLTGGTNTVTVTPLAITVAATGVNKVYNGNLTAAVTLASGGVLAGDSLTYSDTSAAFANKNVANGVAVSVAGIAKSGTGSGNYTVNSTAATTANITPAIVNLSGSRIYDGLLDANASIFGTAGTVNGVAGENLVLSGSGTLNTKNVITNGVMPSSSGLTLGNGTGLASNYQLSGGADTVTVTPLAITVAATGVNKVYNGNLTAAVTLVSGGVLTGDSLTYADTSANFANKNVANGVAVSVAGITESGTGSGNYTVNSTAATTANITPLAITVAATGVNKVYNGDLTAVVTLASSGVLAGDSLSYADTSAAFASKNAANGVAVSVAGITESGTGSGNYTVNSTAATTANITPAIINLSGSRTYDGLLDANASIFGTSGTVSGVAGENLILSGSGALSTKNVITNGAMASSSGLTLDNGTGLASNYQLSGGTDTVTVTPLAITVAGSANSKAYDGTTAATVSALGSSGVIAGDTVNFTDTAASFNTKNVATASTVTIAGITDGGQDAGNYMLNSNTATASANITPTIVNLSGTRTYDGLLDANASIFGTAGTVSGVAGENLILSGSGALSTKNVISNGAMASSSGLTLANGTGLASNYQLSGGADTVTVTPLAITVAGSANSKTYDGTTVATASALGSSGVIAGDTVNFTDTAATFNTKNVTTASTVTIAGITDAGQDSGNYTLNNTTATASANITPATVNLSGSRIYDGLLDANASIFGTSGTVNGVAGENLILSGSGTLSTKSVVTNGAMASSSGLTLGNGTGLASNYQLTGGTDTVTVTPLAITVAATGVNKVYNGNLTAAVTLASSGVLPGDSLSYADTSAAFASKNAANGVPVSVAGITESGTGSGNYTVNSTAATTANITPAIINLSGSRTYDGLLDANASIFGTSGTVSGVAGENLILSGSGALSTKNVITNGAIASSSGLTLGDGTGLASNYQLSGGADTVTVTPLAITVAGSANSKTYDGTTVATASALGSSGVIAGDTVNFTDTAASFNTKNVTTASTVTIAGITDGGQDAGNYTLNNTTATASANITPLAIAVTGSANSKTYDGTTAATVSALGSSGVIGGDTVNFADAAANFNTKNVTTASAVTIAGITDGGRDAGNYTLNNTTATSSANITAAIINLSGTRTYDGLLDANADIFGTAGTVSGVAGENLILSGSGTLSTKNVITNGAMASISGLTLGDGTGLASNYQFTGGTDTVTVTPLAIAVAGSANSKTYDGTAAATVSALGSSGVIGGDTVDFADAAANFNTKNVTTASTVTIAGITDGGRDAGNYTLNNTTAMASANITPATLVETAIPVSVAAGQVPSLNGSLNGFVPGDTRANATVGALVWASNAPVAATTGAYAIDGSGITAGNYLLVQSPTNATALTITAALVDSSTMQSASGLFGSYLAPENVATPYGVGSENDYGNNTGNARRDTNRKDDNQHLKDFSGRLALTVIGAGVNRSAAVAP
jgi:trimeric autotransporter adhesin